MKRRPWECKDNNAASVRIMMTDGASAARLHSASIPDNRPILTASGRQKKVDIGLKLEHNYIYVFRLGFSSRR